MHEIKIAVCIFPNVGIVLWVGVIGRCLFRTRDDTGLVCSKKNTSWGVALLYMLMHAFTTNVMPRINYIEIKYAHKNLSLGFDTLFPRMSTLYIIGKAISPVILHHRFPKRRFEATIQPQLQSRILRQAQHGEINTKTKRFLNCCVHLRIKVIVYKPHLQWLRTWGPRDLNNTRTVLCGTTHVGGHHSPHWWDNCLQHNGRTFFRI